jgi:predicted NAD-dependent protein-ADP-ribosyltransferase YbiA (DUF1768 family)
MTRRNQGEGDRESARRYNEAAQDLARTDQDQAKRAREARPDPEAERKGRDRAREVDPNVHRDYSKPER